MLAVISKFEFCSVTAFGIELVIATFVSVGGEMWTLIVKFFDGRSARDAQFVCGQDFGCDGVIGRCCTHVSAKGTVFGKRDVTA